MKTVQKISRDFDGSMRVTDIEIENTLYPYPTILGDRFDSTYMPGIIDEILPFFNPSYKYVDIDDTSFTPVLKSLGYIVGSKATQIIIKKLTGLVFEAGDIDFVLNREMGMTHKVAKEIEKFMGKTTKSFSHEYYGIDLRVDSVTKAKKGDIIKIKQSLFEYVNNFDLYLSQAIIMPHPAIPMKLIGFIHKQAMEDLWQNKVTINHRAILTDHQKNKTVGRVKKYQKRLGELKQLMNKRKGVSILLEVK